MGALYQKPGDPGLQEAGWARFDAARGAPYAANREAADGAGYGVAMNLKFWKKKPANDDHAKDGSDGDAKAAKASLFSRLKAQTAALADRFGSPPPFKAEVPPGEAEATAEGAVSTETEQPAGLQVSPESLPAASAPARARALLMSLAGRLRAVPEGETPPPGRMPLIVAGLLLLLLLLGAFGYAAWSIVASSPDPGADVAELIADDAPLPIVMPESAPAASDVLDAPAGGDTPSAVPVAEPQETPPASSAAKAEPVAGHPAPVSSPPMTEVEALRRKNAELQAELDALKKAQQSSATVKMYPGGRGAPAGGVATVGSSDPAAAAATLKEAIEAMNNGSNYRQSPAR